MKHLPVAKRDKTYNVHGRGGLSSDGTGAGSQKHPVCKPYPYLYL
jgi:hypothetical protein